MEKCPCDFLGKQHGIVCPLNKILINDYYDGIIGGFGSCGVCGACYAISAVSAKSDFIEFKYLCVRISATDFEAVVFKHQAYDAPRWPIWAPFAGGVVKDRPEIKFPDFSQNATQGLWIESGDFASIWNSVKPCSISDCSSFRFNDIQEIASRS